MKSKYDKYEFDHKFALPLPPTESILLSDTGTLNSESTTRLSTQHARSPTVTCDLPVGVLLR